VLVLVVDSSTPAVTAALAEVTPTVVQVRAQRVTVDARAHGELLAPAVSAVLAEVGARPADLAAVVAGLGPGPFTGLRVGLVTAAALGHTLGIPTYGACSLDALAEPAPGGAGPVQAPSGPHGAAPVDAGVGPDAARTLVATDARRKEVYWAVYDAAGARIAGPGVDPPEAVAACAARLGVTRAVGDGAHRYAAALGLPVADAPRYPVAARLAALAADRVRDGAPGEPLTPLYLRRPDAVEPGVRKAVSQP